MGKNKKERKKEEEREERRKKIQIFVFYFLDCEKYWNSGAIFYIRIAKGFAVFILELLAYLKHRTPF